MGGILIIYTCKFEIVDFSCFHYWCHQTLDSLPTDSNSYIIISVLAVGKVY